MSKKITMTHEEAEKALAEYDWAALVESTNANLIVAVGNKRVFWYMENLIACKKERGIIPTTDLLLAHCAKDGEEYPTSKKTGSSITVIARGIAVEQAIKESLE